MHIAILHNSDHDLLDEDPGREAREDVLRVAAALANALNDGRVSAEPLPIRGAGLEFMAMLERRRPDLVINLCESLAADSRGEMAVPCLLELMRLPYTGSSPLALGLALHKNKAKELLRGCGVRTPEFAVVERAEGLARVDLPFPLIVKPSREDASVGLDFDSVVNDRPALERAVVRVLETFRQPALVERFIPGRELYVPLLGNRPQALALTEMRFGSFFDGRPNIVSYRAKWETASVEFQDTTTAACTLDVETQERVIRTAVAAFEALECRDYGRVDVRLSPEGEPFVIDINPNCDLHPTAGFAKAAAHAGLDYPALARRLVEIALERTHGNPSNLRAGAGAPRRAA
ncbi:MAG TPA: ATP-grasp domain-containing protein [Myxococcaceae bacterium]|nr:ATP-grasp domain-containing protein [Myxococcaceae bacterium]